MSGSAGRRWPRAAQPPQARVTLTLPALNGAATVLFLVTGKSKVEPLARLLGPLGEAPLPAQRVRPRGDRLVFADAAAMGRPSSRAR